MRPEILFPYYTSLSALKGVGPKIAPLLIKHVGAFVRDLVFTLPANVIERPVTTLDKAIVGQVQTIEITIKAYPGNLRGPQRIMTSDPDGDLQLVYFHKIKGFEQKHPVGTKRWVSGRVESFNGSLQITHPDYVVDEDHASDIPRYETIYPATQAISSRMLRRFVNSAMANLPDLPEWIDAEILRKEGWSPFNASLHGAHAPQALTDIDPNHLYRRRLAYDEALAHQLALKGRKANRQASPALILKSYDLASKAQACLPFTFTGAQHRALEDIRHDLSSGYRMNRLIQGDVGSGKTLVALMAMIDVADNGFQSVMMAPTEILARQHYEKTQPILEPLGLTSVLMTGRDKGAVREQKRAAVATGEAAIIFGTHAVFQDGVDFRGLQLAVIDEQHRFGVGQRQKLFLKGDSVHYLSMSATPIPRTLALTAYGEADLSVLDEKPAGRQPIQTAVIPRARLGDVFNRLKTAISDGAQAYWICPLVEETAESDLIAVEARHRELTEIFGTEIGLVHGRMPSIEKDAVVSRFARNELKLLCATTVVEVGIDVPNATIIIIEQAERFGLAQLHQLRGRVGRGSDKSVCILLYDAPLSKTAQARLELLRDTEDGFAIAEADWKLRGEGDVLGAKQSGFPDYRFVDSEKHGDLVAMAARDAVYILQREKSLPQARQQALNILKYLFDWRIEVSDKND
ncbi:ATP-dependent DNA helicase RecG [Asticcacaulis sp. ZE23SCel15]|uniref:ATP-dependent DNA helicase RecG n=1 Tax=Asticcacaulis sp. ZE23SCel15 TaxID=3059027 RepID=UPI00265EBF8E|nr:ATP-dependent DNA helicase RecG [Asticcacaulis sp. ZE23SCel15]WKL56617.1 ATP-dependent DNA helicase RecG [Asticcacaulis sp. ZE23SCel15]